MILIRLTIVYIQYNNIGGKYYLLNVCVRRENDILVYECSIRTIESFIPFKLILNVYINGILRNGVYMLFIKSNSI